MNDKAYRQPTAAIRQWVDELLDRNDYTRGGKAAEVYLSPEYLVVHVARPTVIEGQLVDDGRTADLIDLMDDWRAENGRPEIP